MHIKKTKNYYFDKKNMKTKSRGVSHCGLAIYIKRYLSAKEEL
jgi:hypothetical protein